MNTIETTALQELNAMIDAAQFKADALVEKLDALEKKIENREKRVAFYARKRKVIPAARRSAQPKNNTMRHNRLKVVITAKNQTQYFLGDGFWFGRISKAKFEEKLTAGCTIFQTISHLP